jgi:D-aminoacyl-tRNA deacylase
LRAVIQRVKRAKVLVNNNIVGKIDSGLLIFLGIGQKDDESDADYLVEKIVNLRIFEDEENKMNFSTLDLNKEVLVISQFTLYGDCRKGKRPGFISAAKPEEANNLYEYFIKKVSKLGLRVETGIFQKIMEVELVNDGPVTFLLDSNKIF